MIKFHIFLLDIMRSPQKLGTILENKALENLEISKNVNNKSYFAKPKFFKN